MTNAALWSFPKSARWEETLVLLCFAQPNDISIRICTKCNDSGKCFVFLKWFSFSRHCFPYTMPSPKILQDVLTERTNPPSLAGLTCKALVMYQIMSPTRPKFNLCLEVHIIFCNPVRKVTGTVPSTKGLVFKQCINTQSELKGVEV